MSQGRRHGLRARLLSVLVGFQDSSTRLEGESGFRVLVAEGRAAKQRKNRPMCLSAAPAGGFTRRNTKFPSAHTKAECLGVVTDTLQKMQEHRHSRSIIDALMTGAMGHSHESCGKMEQSGA